MEIKGYMAASIDGYVADRFGGVDWLDPFNSVDAGYDQFVVGIGTVVFGRATYDQSLGFPGEWGFAGKRSIVVTRHPLIDPPEGVERWGDGVPALIKSLKDDPNRKAAWVIGGAKLQAAFIELAAIDTLDLFVVPVLLGDGVRMFPPSGRRHKLDLQATEALGLGMVHLKYSMAGAAA